MHHAHLPGAVGAGELGGAAAVGEHEARGAESACDGRAARGGAGSGVEHVAAVHGHHERHVEAGAAHRLTGGHSVVGVNHLEAAVAAQAAQGERQRGRRPRAPRGVGRARDGET